MADPYEQFPERKDSGEILQPEMAWYYETRNCSVQMSHLAMQETGLAPRLEVDALAGGDVYYGLEELTGGFKATNITVVGRNEISVAVATLLDKQITEPDANKTLVYAVRGNRLVRSDTIVAFGLTKDSPPADVIAWMEQSVVTGADDRHKWRNKYAERGFPYIAGHALVNLVADIVFGDAAPRGRMPVAQAKLVTRNVHALFCEEKHSWIL